MINKPKTCCAMGTYDCQVPMPVGGRVRGIDLCVADIVAALLAANIQTEASCCGHGEQQGIISLTDGRCLIIQTATRNEGAQDEQARPDESRRG